MVTLNITGAWVHLSDRESTRQEIPVAAIGSNSAARGQVRQYASGVRRSIVAPGATTTLSLELVWVPRTVAELLASWVGDVIVYRDRLGRVVWGQLTSVNLTESPEAPDDTVAGVAVEITPTTETAEIV